MPILSIRHVTTYHYNQPVAFGEHRMMLRPRDDDDQKVLKSEIEITPAPLQLAWSQDIFGNHVAIAHFDDRAAELRFASDIRLDHAPAGFRATDIAESARSFPFAYAAEDWPALKRFTRPPSARREKRAIAPAISAISACHPTIRQWIFAPGLKPISAAAGTHSTHATTCRVSDAF